MADTGGSASKMALPSGAAALRSVSSLGGLPAIVDDDTELVRINTLVPFHSFSVKKEEGKEKKEKKKQLHTCIAHHATALEIVHLMATAYIRAGNSAWCVAP